MGVWSIDKIMNYGKISIVRLQHFTLLWENVMNDPTETFRRAEVARINADPGSRKALEAKHGQVWDTKEMCRDFDAVGFGAPYVMVVRKIDKVKGSLEFQHNPRFYYSFQKS